MSSNATTPDCELLQAIPEQIIPNSSQNPAKERRSTKALPLKMEVISRFTLGQSKFKISKDLGIAPNTVAGIIKESKIETGDFAAARFGVNSLVVDSVAGIEHHVRKKSLRASMYVLDNTIFKDASGKQSNTAVQVNINIPRPSPVTTPIIETKVLSDSTE